MITRRSFLATAVAGASVGRLVVKRNRDAWWKNAPLRPATTADLNRALRDAYSEGWFKRAEGFYRP